MLNIGRTGLSFTPELSRREDIDFEETVKVIQANKPLIQGVKLRAVGPAVATMGIEIMHLAKQAAREGNVRLMVHIGDPEAKDGPTLTRQLIPLLESGDILTHLFTGNPGHILDNDGKVVPELMDAQEHGIFLDTAHGRLNFSFDVAKRALDQGVRPQSISTDLNILGRQMIVHSLVEMMARFLALGFDLDDVIRMTTINPAKALHMEDVLGSLAVGRRADITVLREVSGNWVFRDSVGGTLTGTKALVPTVTVKSGEIFSPDWGPHPWGWLPETTP
jgi:dihydroorotase